MEPVAIVGLSCRLPGADSPAAFWKLLTGGVDAVGTVPRERWSVSDFYDANPAAPGKMTTRWGGFLNSIDGFDASFFGIAPREAQRMDPQQRLLLELSWEALEDAGLVPQRLAGSSTGVFIGFGVPEYSHVQLRDPTLIDGYTNTGYFPCILANRISYTFDFRGPSLSVDTACSSSLVAIQLACRSLDSGESTLALAAGVSLMIDPVTTIGFSKLSAMSPDGRCHTFDARANGYVRGEGAGLVVLKRLDQARRDGDHIYAVIRGEAVNQDGRSNGLTAPNRWAQEAVLRACYARAGVSPGDVQYVEAHGTGTLLGDPIEASALGAVLAEGRRPGDKCAIGSLKTNIGHLEAAAGVAGVIKLALSIEHRQLPPHLNFDTPNPHIPFDRLPLKVQTRLEPWPATSEPLLAGISSFGFGGTNAHLLLESAPPTAIDDARSAAIRTWHVLPLSARDPVALKELAERYASLLEAGSASLADVCHAAAVSRSHHQHRLAVVAQTAAETIERLRAFARGESADGLHAGRIESSVQPQVAMLFTGQGSQFAGMGRQLYDEEPVFRQAIDRCHAILSELLDAPLIDVLFAAPAGGSLLDDTAYTQPALFAIEYALAELWKSWGVEPAAVLGHSLGEYVAATVAGIMRLDEALPLVARRARLMSQLPRAGGMAAVFADRQQVDDVLTSHRASLCVAAYNGETNIVISGALSNLAEASAEFARRNIVTRQLNVSHAFHSPLVEPVLDDFTAMASQVAYALPQVGFVTNLTGQWLPDGMTLSQEYLREHIRSPVQFHAGIETLVGRRYEAFLEIGPGSTLLVLAERSAKNHSCASLPSLMPRRSESEQMLSSLAQLYVRGADIAWSHVYLGRPPRIELPAYPFQRKRFWVDAASPHAALAAVAAGGDGGSSALLGRRLHTAIPTYETRIQRDALAWLWDHVVHGMAVMPAAAWLEMALRMAAVDDAGSGITLLEKIVFREPLLLDGDEAPTVQGSLLPDGAFQFASALGSTTERAWRAHVVGRVGESNAREPRHGDEPSLSAAQAACALRVDVDALYADLDQCGLQYGPAFRAVRQVFQGSGQALGLVAVPELCQAHAAQSPLHAALLDGCFHVVFAAVRPANAASPSAWLPLSIERLALHRSAGEQVFSHATLRRAPDDNVQVVDLRLFDLDGALVAEIDGLVLARASRAALQKITQAAADDDRYELQWRAAPSAVAADAPAVDGAWMILADRGGISERHAAWIRAQGQICTMVVPADKFAALGDDRYQLCAARLDDWHALFDDLKRRGRSPNGVLHCWNLDAPANSALDARAWSLAWDLGLCSVLHLAQASMAAGCALGRLWIVTRGAEAVFDEQTHVSLAQSSVGGFARTLAWEYRDLDCATIDLDPAAESSDLHDAIQAQLADENRENRVAYRSNVRYVARLGRLKQAPSAAPRSNRSPSDGVRLDIHRRGVLDDLSLEPLTRRAPAAGEVEIRIKAAGLNFRDVLNALGMYPGDAGPLGGECSGTIVAVGDGVDELRCGMDVMCIAPGSFADFVTVPAAMVVRKPSRCSFPEAATIPIAFVTAWLALHHFGKIRRGDRVLIHAATGGVGQAALQLARCAGAEVFATAGNAAKRALLVEQGAKRVMSSRTLDFADEIKTFGDGTVDLVLNSLAGEFIPKSLSLLRAGGRFVEIGKIGVWDAGQVAETNPGVGYFTFDLAELCRTEPALVQSILCTLLDEFEAGRIGPLPAHAFALDNAAAAFRFMAQAKHVGKVVLTPRVGAPMPLAADASYLITGGFGGLGMRVADWMAKNGARRLLLLGRRAHDDAETRQTLARLRSLGVEVVALEADVGDLAQLGSVLGAALASAPPLRGIVHAAGILDDGVVARQDWSRFQPVLRSKSLGAWNLHQSTFGQPLDFFVCFSSVTALLGSPGQANYAAANAALDALVHERRRRGLPALSINWGPWGEVGMAARTSGRGVIADFPALPPDRALEALDDLMAEGRAQAAVLRAGWSKAFERLGAAAPPLLRNLEMPGRPPIAADAPRIDLRARLESAPRAERAAVLRDHLSEAIAKALGLRDARAIEPRRPLRELGLDSLMAVEVQNWISSSLERKLPTTLLFDYPTLEALADFLAAELSGSIEQAADGASDRPPVVAASAPHAATIDPSDTSSAAELAGLLAAELAIARGRSDGFSQQR